MDLLQEFRDFAGKENLFSKGDRLLLAVSGGMDSVVLCDICQQAGVDFVIAHCNFRLRGKESDHDEDFVRGLGKKYNIEVLVRAFETSAYAEEKKVSVQVAARELRYLWFRELLAPLPAKGAQLPPEYPPLTRIATAHHLDDNIETLLMNFFKGTGIAGLRGMLPLQDRIIRPLLFAGKEDLREYALSGGLDWVEDSSNESDKYTRNYFRHQLIPLVERVYPGAMHNLSENLERFREIEWIYLRSIEAQKKNLLEPRGAEVHIPVLKLKKSKPLPTLVYEIIREFGFSPRQVDELIHLLDSETGKYIRSSTHRILKNRSWLIISPFPDAAVTNILIEKPEGKVVYAEGELTFQWIDPAPVLQAPLPDSKPGKGKPEGRAIALLDAASIRFPLILRKWKPGDYFYPLGMRKKKKLARFFIDSKLSMTDKEKTWVLEMDKKIIWVVGLRIDDRFRVTANTARTLMIESRLA